MGLNKNKCIQVIGIQDGVAFETFSGIGKAASDPEHPTPSIFFISQEAPLRRKVWEEKQKRRTPPMLRQRACCQHVLQMSSPTPPGPPRPSCLHQECFLTSLMAIMLCWGGQAVSQFVCVFPRLYHWCWKTARKLLDCAWVSFPVRVWILQPEDCTSSYYKAQIPQKL